MINLGELGVPAGWGGESLVPPGTLRGHRGVFFFLRHQRSRAWGRRKHLERAGAAGRGPLNSTPHVPLSLCGQLFYGRRAGEPF